jgi:hypothetical protein
MSKYLFFLLAVCLSFSLVACTDNQSQSNTFSTDNIYSSEIVETEIAESTVNHASISKDANNTILEKIITECGSPFCFYSPEEMNLYYFVFSDTHARREVHSFEDGLITYESLKWEIANEEMIVSGDWNETFTIDLDHFTATSKTDGKVYRIIPEQQ